MDRLVLEARIVSGVGGGPDKTILNTPRFMRSRGYPTVCGYLRDPSDPGFASIEKRAADWQAPLETVDDRGVLDFGAYSRTVALCRRLKPAIWHGHDYKTNLYGLLVNRSIPMTLVTTVHGWVKRTWKTPLYYGIDKYCLKRHQAVLCVSTDLHDECLRLGVRPDRCHYVPNGVDVAEFSRRCSPESARLRQGLPSDRLVVGAVGRLSPEKGFDLLIEASAELWKAGSQFDLHLFGDGDERVNLERLVHNLGVEQFVKFRGFASDLDAAYSAMDIFVLSSRREGLPNVVLEAMAYELPILATKIAGVPSAVKDGETGVLIEPNSVRELARGLLPLLGDALMRRRLGAAARAKVVDQFSLDVRMDRVVKIYDSLFKRSRMGVL